MLVRTLDTERGLGGPSLPASRSWASSLQNRKKTRLGPPVCGALSRPPNQHSPTRHPRPTNDEKVPRSVGETEQRQARQPGPPGREGGWRHAPDKHPQPSLGPHGPHALLLKDDELHLRL